MSIRQRKERFPGDTSINLISLDESGRKGWSRKMDFKDGDIICPVDKGEKVLLGPLGAGIV